MLRKHTALPFPQRWFPVRALPNKSQSHLKEYSASGANSTSNRYKLLSEIISEMCGTLTDKNIQLIADDATDPDPVITSCLTL